MLIFIKNNFLAICLFLLLLIIGCKTAPRVKPVMQTNTTKPPIVTNPDGALIPVVVTNPDGTVIPVVVINPDSTVTPVVIDPDGTVIPAVINPDGTVSPVVVNPDSTINPVVINPDGTVTPVVINPDGTVEPIVEQDCGILAFEPMFDYRAIGDVADVNNYPFFVRLVRIKKDYSYKNVCSGVIVAPNKILTAAHCVHGFPLADYMHSIKTLNTPDPCPITPLAGAISVSNIYENPTYNAVTFNNDLAVVELNQNIAYNAKQAPILFYADDKLNFGDKTTTMGWSKEGTVIGGVCGAFNTFTSALVPEPDNPADRTKLVHNVGALADQEYGAYPYPLPLQGMFPGDSGGPMIAGVREQNYLVGINFLIKPRWTLGAGFNLSTRLSSYIDFLRQTTGLQEAVWQGADILGAGYELNTNNTGLVNFKRIEVYLQDLTENKQLPLSFENVSGAIKINFDDCQMALLKKYYSGKSLTILAKFFYGGDYNNQVSKTVVVQ
jgi:hypothetical protein